MNVCAFSVFGETIGCCVTLLFSVFSVSFFYQKILYDWPYRSDRTFFVAFISLLAIFRRSRYDDALTILPILK